MTTAVEVAEKGHQLAAWVNFNGTLAMTVGSSYGPDAPPADYSSPNPIRAAYNVASITDNATGNYTVNFATAMPDTNYVVVCSADNSGYENQTNAAPILSSFAVSSIGIKTGNTVNASFQDFSVVNVSIFR